MYARISSKYEFNEANIYDEGQHKKRKRKKNRNQTMTNTIISTSIITPSSPIISFVVITEAGIDEFNKDNETYIDIVADKKTTLQKINDSILFTLVVNETTEIIYKIIRSDIELDLSLTLKELGITDGTKILAIFKKSQATSILQDKILNDNDVDDSGLIELSCVTRICDSYGEPFTNIKVLVHESSLCKNFMQDIGKLWNKNGLKFKIGRIVLNSEKTFKQMEIKDGMQVKITGGRLNRMNW